MLILYTQAKSLLPSLEDLRRVVRPAVPAAEGSEQASDSKAWLRNLVCGFDMDIPLETIQEKTIGVPPLPFPSRAHPPFPPPPVNLQRPYSSPACRP